MSNSINHPSHYADHYRHEVIELTGLLDFNTGNAVKYLLRSRFKGDELEDLSKANQYLEYILSGKFSYPKAFYGKKNMLCKYFEADLEEQNEPELALIMSNIRRAQIPAAQFHLAGLIQGKSEKEEK